MIPRVKWVVPENLKALPYSVDVETEKVVSHKALVGLYNNLADECEYLLKVIEEKLGGK